jgi:hypothetical protein
LLIVGAGASLEECKRSGKYSGDKKRYLPLISNFCNKLFNPTSQSLLLSTASYLDYHGIQYDSKLLNLKAGDKFTGLDIARGPVGVFLQLEKADPKTHNIEKLCEFVWLTFNKTINFWDEFIYEGIYLKLFVLFTDQFGAYLGRPMKAGTRVANQLIPGDVVINLNYDIVFDLALKQTKKNFCYAPKFNQELINVFKPHGSFNLYVNLENKKFYFEEPDKIYGSVSISDQSGGCFSPYSGIVPPRLNKNYRQHYIASSILETGRPFHPKIITFWGIGLTESDIDLNIIYKEAALVAEAIEFINPDNKAYSKAVDLLGNRITHYHTLDEWFDANNIY